MAEKKAVQITDKKKGDCGCGCIGITEKGANQPKPSVNKPKK